MHFLVYRYPSLSLMVQPVEKMEGVEKSVIEFVFGVRFYLGRLCR